MRILEQKECSFGQKSKSQSSPQPHEALSVSHFDPPQSLQQHYHCPGIEYSILLAIGDSISLPIARCNLADEESEERDSRDETNALRPRI